VADRADVVAFLASLGAGAVPHPGGTLLAHLQRTADLLASWAALPPVVLAGLCHAVYGTEAFPAQLVSDDARHRLRDRIGDEAESMVYLYGSCDRAHLARQAVSSAPPTLRDRFTGDVSVPDDDLFRSFVELTAANELDVITVNAAFAANGGAIARTLTPFAAWMTNAARDAWAERYPGPFLEATHQWFEVNSGWAPPDPETLAEWIADGVCRCPDDCLVAPEGWCEHGLASWWRVLRHSFDSS
jgi:hypothetical protein